MKLRKLVLMLLCALLLTTAVCAGSSELVEWDSLHTYGDEALANTRIDVQDRGGWCLFLPANADLTRVPLYLDILEPSATVTVVGDNGTMQISDGDYVDLLTLCGEQEVYTLTLRVQTEMQSEEMSLTLYPSANVDAMYLVSDDPVNKGREWVEASVTKDNKATGAMVLQGADSTVVYDDLLTQIKGRGNSTWKLSKKPYQIKLDSKTDLLQTGNSDNESKTWVLLANFADQASIRNTIALGLGAEMGMEYYMENRMIDLYYDGEYRGTYLLCEKVEIKDGRVEITDLEGANEDANSGIDLEELTVSVAQTANGATYTYCEGMNDPADTTGGYLLEMEVPYRTADEVCYFYTSRSNYVVVKSPEFASKTQMDYIATIYQEYEDALYNNGVNPETGKHYTEYVDLESTAKCYIVNELAKNLDGFRTSAYIYKEAGVDLMKMGPLWDYDLGFGVGAGVELQIQTQIEPEGFYTARSIFGRLLYQQGDFRVAVRDLYVNTVYPVLRDVLFGDLEASSAVGGIRSFDYYRQEYGIPAMRDRILWRGDSNPLDAWEGHVAYLENYMRIRSDDLLNAISTWNEEAYEQLSMFLDVSEDKWYCDVIIEATRYGLMQGTGIAIFSPENVATRAAVVQVLYNIEDPLPTGYVAGYKDLDVTGWYMPAVNWAAEHGVIQGYPDGTFRPNKQISRQELVSLLYRHCGSPEVSGNSLDSFKDGETVNDYAKDAMEWAVQNGIVLGYDDGTIRPEASTKRCELAAIMVRYYETVVLAEG